MTMFHSEISQIIITIEAPIKNHLALSVSSYLFSGAKTLRSLGVSFFIYLTDYSRYACITCMNIILKIILVGLILWLVILFPWILLLAGILIAAAYVDWD